MKDGRRTDNRAFGHTVIFGIACRGNESIDGNIGITLDKTGADIGRITLTAAIDVSVDFATIPG